jgi:hypothetical protein
VVRFVPVGFGQEQEPNYRFRSRELVADLVLGVVRDGDHFVGWGVYLILSVVSLLYRNLDTCRDSMRHNEEDRGMNGVPYRFVNGEAGYPNLQNQCRHKRKGCILMMAFFSSYLREVVRYKDMYPTSKYGGREVKERKKQWSRGACFIVIVRKEVQARE